MDYLLSDMALLCSRHWEDNRDNVKSFFSRVNHEVSFRFVEKLREYDGNKKAKHPKELDSCKWHDHEPGFEGSCNPAPNKKRKRA